ncbi:MAG: rhodanese-related sulfurtransferase [Planctomycetota bacterium]|jgi:rhodanese-related sulfurtransferase
MIDTILAGSALALALMAFIRAQGNRQRLEQIAADGRRETNNGTDELERRFEVQTALMARMASGEAITPDMVLNGELFRDVGGAEAQQLVAKQGAMLIDVRTPGETSGGIIPGALLIPMDEVESRMHEIPKEGIKIIYCAAGIRSAGVCDALAMRGYQGLLNLDSGIPAWTGFLEKP